MYPTCRMLRRKAWRKQTAALRDLSQPQGVLTPGVSAAVWLLNSVWAHGSACWRKRCFGGAGAGARPFLAEGTSWDHPSLTSSAGVALQQTPACLRGGRIPTGTSTPRGHRPPAPCQPDSKARAGWPGHSRASAGHTRPNPISLCTRGSREPLLPVAPVLPPAWLSAAQGGAWHLQPCVPQCPVQQDRSVNTRCRTAGVQAC